MRAARLLPGETGLRIVDIPAPELRKGCVIVRIERAFATPFMAEIVHGSAGYRTPPRPFTPGSEAVGIVDSVAPDVISVSPGTRVFCDSFVESNVQGIRTGLGLIGCFGMGAGGDKLMMDWPDGVLASHMLLPAECVTSIEPALARSTMDVLTRLGWLGTAQSAFDRVNFQPGSTVSVVGATGLLGVAAVLLALANGASRVVCVGRNLDRLQALSALGSRIEIATTAPKGIDLAISALNGDDPSLVEQSISGLNHRGAMVMLASLKRPPSIAGLVGNEISVMGSLWFRARPLAGSLP
jgi:alcohol dehydrogenase